ncbi:MAG: tyrosine-protein phosphatase [Oscillospiraceae bacterium]|nr:tyrosine-protein phosphatase [Oscillospiraceae bacterium]
MSKKRSPAATNPDSKSMRWRKPAALLLAASLCLLFGYGCRGDEGETEPQKIPTWNTEPSSPTEVIPSTETSSPTEETFPTETSYPTESVTPTESTQATQPPLTTEPAPTEPPAPSTNPPTEDVEIPTETTAPTQPAEPTEPTIPETTPPMQIQISPDRSEVLLIPKNAQAFSLRDLTKPVEYGIYAYKTVHQRLDIGVAVPLSVEITNIPQGVEVTSITITLADNEDLIGGRMFRLTGNQKYVKVPFLLANKQYHYQVRIDFSNGTTQVLQTSFRTAAAPRLLSIDGIVNVRDIGGWKTTDGNVIRQGLLYRGSELDGAVQPEYKLTAEGKRQMLQALGIRTDMDLRHAGEIGEPAYPLGKNVSYFTYDARPYDSTFSGHGRNAVCRIFADLADQSKYPIYLHCTYGADRTGTICCLLEALLGVSEEDLQREYELSTMYYTWVDSQGFRNLISELKQWEGVTLQEKAEAFLLDCGVTQEQIAQIRNILLEKQ